MCLRNMAIIKCFCNLFYSQLGFLVVISQENANLLPRTVQNQTNVIKWGLPMPNIDNDTPVIMDFNSHFTCALSLPSCQITILSN